MKFKKMKQVGLQRFGENLEEFLCTTLGFENLTDLDDFVKLKDSSS